MNKDESEKIKKTKKTKKAKKPHIDKGASAISLFKSLWKKIKEEPLASVVVALTVVLVVANLILAYFNWQSNKRAEKLFVGQNKPLIDVTPIGIVQVERKDEKKTKMCATLFSVVNYSGFKAYNIAYDIKYGSDWISEWVKAEDNRKEKVEKRVILNHLYTSRPKVIIPKLMPGETKGGDFKWPPDASGELDCK